MARTEIIPNIIGALSIAPKKLLGLNHSVDIPKIIGSVQEASITSIARILRDVRSLSIRDVRKKYLAR